MEALIYLDTNVALWLVGARDQLSERSVALINAAECVLISPMVELEIEYLHEIGRLNHDAATVLDCLRAGLNLRHCQRAFATVVTAARAIKWTRDPFDRLITAQAAAGSDVLVTRDKVILANYPGAAW